MLSISPELPFLSVFEAPILMSFTPLFLLPAFPTPARLTPLRSSLCILACFLRLLIASLYLIVSLYSLISFFSKLLTYLLRSCIFCRSDCIIFCSSAFSSRCWRSFSCSRNRFSSSCCWTEESVRRRGSGSEAPW